MQKIYWHKAFASVVTNSKAAKIQFSYYYFFNMVKPPQDSLDPIKFCLVNHSLSLLPYVVKAFVLVVEQALAFSNLL